MKATYEYIMTSSDQTLRIFSRLNDPIYSVKLILIMLTYILLLQLISQSVNPTFCYWGLSLQPNFQKGGLDSIPIFRVGLLGKRG